MPFTKALKRFIGETAFMPPLIQHSAEDDCRPCSLNIQHHYFQTALGHGQSVRLPLDPSQVETVLDIAAGTGSWILGVAHDPIIASRLSSPTDKLKLLACDLSLAKFPPKLTSGTSNPKIRVFQQDVTQPFPEELRGTVDVAHMSILVWALTQHGWERALRNIYDVLSE
jgi:SAM-dependent methyltransferase